MHANPPSVVCGVDGSNASIVAIRMASRLAAAIDGRLILTGVVADRPDGASTADRLRAFSRTQRAEFLVLSSHGGATDGVVPELAGCGDCPVIVVPTGYAAP